MAKIGTFKLEYGTNAENLGPILLAWVAYQNTEFSLSCPRTESAL